MDVEQYFRDYGAGVSSGDPQQVAGFYGFPCSLLTDDFVGHLDSHGELVATLTRANAYYRQFGLAEARPELLAVDEVTAKITRVRVRWHYLGPDGEPLIDSTYEYVMRADPEGVRIYVVISLDEQQKLAQLRRRTESGT
jgi:hypothetical protein